MREGKQEGFTIDKVVQNKANKVEKDYNQRL